jgi:protein associated with RNAse G/E
MGIEKKWEYGDAILYRSNFNEKIWWAQSMVVIQDSDDQIVLLCKAGFPQMSPKLNPQRRLTVKDFLSMNEMEMVKSEWKRTDVLRIIRPKNGFCVFVMWGAETHEHYCWYINIQEPIKRTKLGFETHDLTLDIVISPDKQKWEWKDEDELKEFVKAGVYSEDKASYIRREGEKALQLFFDNKSPFCDGWENWEIPNDISIPNIPNGWDTIK